MGKHYPEELKIKIVKEYFEGTYGGSTKLGKKYNIHSHTIESWIKKYEKQGNLTNDIDHKRGRPKEDFINYKERYQILKKYQAFIKARREKK